MPHRRDDRPSRVRLMPRNERLAWGSLVVWLTITATLKLVIEFSR